VTRPQEETATAIRFDQAAAPGGGMPGTSGGGGMPGTTGIGGKPATVYGFVGRDRDIEAIERRIAALA
jgi:hypothetical protein